MGHESSVVIANFNFYSVAADAILALHFGFVIFVVLGLILIWSGYFIGWKFVWDLRFRLAHLFAIGFVLAEAVFGLTCPLTIWENDLRAKAGEAAAYSGSFMQHWVGRFLFHDWPEAAFTILYAAFFALVLLSWWVVKPRRSGLSHRRTASPTDR